MGETMKQCSKYCVRYGWVASCDLLERNNKEKDYPCLWKREAPAITEENIQQGEFWEIEQEGKI